MRRLTAILILVGMCSGCRHGLHRCCRPWSASPHMAGYAPGEAWETSSVSGCHDGSCGSGMHEYAYGDSEYYAGAEEIGTDQAGSPETNVYFTPPGE
ncbi:MAG: hypothetical protein KDA42_09810 [Planctomycetales bacterium]|nr:hypothetical protein [Planctomycetales bacterium]